MHTANVHIHYYRVEYTVINFIIIIIVAVYYVIHIEIT